MRSFEKRQEFSFKGSESLFTKPYELLMTHEKNEVSNFLKGSLNWIF